MACKIEILKSKKKRKRNLSDYLKQLYSCLKLSLMTHTSMCGMCACDSSVNVGRVGLCRGRGMGGVTVRAAQQAFF